MSEDNQPKSQVPQPGAEIEAAPVVALCGDISKSTETGPTAGILPPAIIPSGDRIQESDDPADFQRLYRGGDRIGIAPQFVMVNHWRTNQPLRVVPEVAGYLKAMTDAASKEGVQLGITSGFRTMVEQQGLWDIASNNPNGPGTGNRAAEAGHSNHQNGIAFDFNWWHQDGRTFEWMVKNAWKYGFIRAVPDERWHWEYWGNWNGQTKPSWANGWHSPKTMFSIVGRVHSVRIPGKNLWTTRLPWTVPHADGFGVTNSWIGAGNEHLPDKFDRLYPGEWNAP